MAGRQTSVRARVCDGGSGDDVTLGYLFVLHGRREDSRSGGGRGAAGTPVNPLFANQPLSIFEHRSILAGEHRAANLGQGFPDFGWPADVIAVARDALTNGSNQYPPMR